jgi:hypothetical protein
MCCCCNGCCCILLLSYAQLLLPLAIHLRAFGALFRGNDLESTLVAG